ncbi:MAG TPA: xanthan lyase, partial [Ignavibacteria bacterium]|nr:xanthan lyase [Ignavibacteria bacterium]
MYNSTDLYIGLFITTNCKKAGISKSTFIQSKKIIFSTKIKERNFDFNIPFGTKLESFIVDPVHKKIKIVFNRPFSYQPFRNENVAHIYKVIKDFWGKRFKNYKFSIQTLGYPIEKLIPNYYRSSHLFYDSTRIPPKINRPNPVVKNISKLVHFKNGLYNKNIVVAPSHGWYFNTKKDRWEWQRPRLFQSVEDLLPNAFCIPYLIPMLENAGANVFDPREKDIQTKVVVVDNDSKIDIRKGYYREKSFDIKNNWKTGTGKGFKPGKLPYRVDYNPFTKGTYRTIFSDTVVTGKATWMPDVPQTGYYAVYVSYFASKNNVDDAHYVVYHEGIRTDFSVNQQIGGSTWEYLGEFKFKEGYHPDSDKVVLINKSSEPNKIVSADAVRFGGGMGVVSRGGRTSQRPKFVEASRYYLQYAGMPDSLYNFNHDANDYNDDKQDRSKYVNYLNGSSVNDKKGKGLGIPVDVSLAFHTDAGVTHNGKVIGTLVLYGDKGENLQTVFPNGVSRLANRDLADIVQTEVVNEIRNKYDPDWTRR